MEDTFDPDMTYRFVVFFNVGDNDAVDEVGPEQIIVKSFPINVTANDYDRLVYIDDHTNGAWTRLWQTAAWEFGQLGNCTDPSIGIFGFDTDEIDGQDQMDRLMQVWKDFHDTQGYETGSIETMILTPEEYQEYDGGERHIFA